MSDLCCSFCGKDAKEVGRLIGACSASICDECVALCADPLDDEDLALATTEGQLLVRFLDGSIHLCEQQHAWTGFVHDGADLQWCAALAFARTPTPMPVAAVRAGERTRAVIGSTFPAHTTIREADARAVVDAFGGSASTRQAAVPSATRRIANRELQRVSPQLGMSGIGPKELASVLAVQYRIPTVDLDAYEISPETLRLVSYASCVELAVLPVSRAGASIVVACADPTDSSALEKLRTETGLNIEPVIAPASAIRAAIARYFPGRR